MVSLTLLCVCYADCDNILTDTAVMNFLREYGPLSPSKRKDTPTGKILAASAAQLAEELLEQISSKRKLTMVSE